MQKEKLLSSLWLEDLEFTQSVAGSLDEYFLHNFSMLAVLRVGILRHSHIDFNLYKATMTPSP